MITVISLLLFFLFNDNKLKLNKVSSLAKFKILSSIYFKAHFRRRNGNFILIRY